jgi:hypothetical protein
MYVIELIKVLKYDQLIASASMNLIHRVFKSVSLRILQSKLLLVATATVFLVCKVRYMPVSLETAALTMFLVEARFASGSVVAAPGRSHHLATSRAQPAFTEARKQNYKAEIEAEEMRVLEAVGFDLECCGAPDLVYGSVQAFFEAGLANFACREHLYTISNVYCNDSFKLPLCLYYHPKVIAAACIQSAMLYRQQNGMDAGVEPLIKGHKWYQWIDADIDKAQIIEILTHMKSLYSK